MQAGCNGVKGNVYKTDVTLAMFCSLEVATLAQKQEAELEVPKLKML